MDRERKDSRKAFLKAGLLAGGALYASPAAALAMTGGRPFFDNGVWPNARLYPKNTKISKWIAGLNDNAGNLTLGTLGGLAETSEATLTRIYQKFPQVTFNDLGDIMAVVVKQLGNEPIVTVSSGKIIINCAACCCCCCF